MDTKYNPEYDSDKKVGRLGIGQSIAQEMTNKIIELEKANASLHAQVYNLTSLDKPLSTPTVDNINPNHYRDHPSGIECIDIVRYMNFNRGNAIKYIWRAGKKDNEIHDLNKAIWYLKDEIKRLSNDVK